METISINELEILTSLQAKYINQLTTRMQDMRAEIVGLEGENLQLLRDLEATGEHFGDHDNEEYSELKAQVRELEKTVADLLAKDEHCPYCLQDEAKREWDRWRKLLDTMIEESR